MKRGTKTNNFNGPVAGMGIDIVDIPRFRKILASRGKRFIDRIFLPGEKKYCRAKARPWIHYAGRFAAKEAVAKAFGTGIGGKISWRDIEIISADLKAPVVKLSLRAQKLARQRRIRRVFISISHTRAYTTAAALLA